MRAAVQHALHPSAVDLDALKVSEGEGLLHSLVHQRARLAQHIELAVETGDASAAIRGESAVTANLTLVSKLLGVLVNVSEHRHQHLLTHPDYLRLREVLLHALAGFPEARIAVGRALAGIETAAAESIVAAAKGRARPEPMLLEHEATASGGGKNDSPPEVADCFLAAAAAGKRKAEPVLIDVTPNRPEPPTQPGPPPPPPPY
jgi:hypothetical protein